MYRYVTLKNLLIFLQLSLLVSVLSFQICYEIRMERWIYSWQRNLSNLCYADDTVLIVNYEDEMVKLLGLVEKVNKEAGSRAK